MIWIASWAPRFGPIRCVFSFSSLCHISDIHMYWYSEEATKNIRRTERRRRRNTCAYKILQHLDAHFQKRRRRRRRRTQRMEKERSKNSILEKKILQKSLHPIGIYKEHHHLDHDDDDEDDIGILIGIQVTKRGFACIQMRRHQVTSWLVMSRSSCCKR